MIRAVPGLEVWVVYDHPSDFPDNAIVVRRQWAGPGGTIERDRVAFAFDDLVDAQVWLMRRQLVRMDRHPDDDPVIVETWL